MRNPIKRIRKAIEDDDMQRVQYDDTNTNRITKFLRGARNPNNYLPFAPLLLAGTIGAFGYMTSAKMPVLAWQDFNKDGVKDALVVFPIKGTEVGLVGYIDGNTQTTKNSAVKGETNVNIFEFNSLHGRTAPRWCNRTNAPAYFYVDIDAQETEQPTYLWVNPNEVDPIPPRKVVRLD